MTRSRPGEYVYRDEVLPILTIGVAFNLATSFIVAWAKGAYGFGFGWYLGIGHLFQDTSGTCFAALVLGPWWGATVGVISSTLNTFWISEQFGDAFAYTCVQIGLALAWGYVGRLVSAEETLVHAPSAALNWKSVRAFLALLIAGALTATVLADLVKATLLEKAGGAIYQGLNHDYYAAIEQKLLNLGLASAARVMALGIFDSYANFIDKGLSLIIALALARAIGVIPSDHTFGRSYLPPRLSQRMKVGADSILWFLGIYSGYLFISWFVLQNVHFMYSPEGSVLAGWMQQLAALLLFPYPIAIICLTFFSLDRYQDPHVEHYRLGRRQLYDRIRGPMPWSTAGLEQSRFLFLQQNSGYGLVGSLVMWPIKSYLLNAQALWIYFFGMSALSLLFVYERRESLRWFKKAQEWGRATDAYFAASGSRASTPGMVAVFNDIMSEELMPCPGGQFQIGQTALQVSVNCAKSGWLEQVKHNREFDHVLILAQDGPVDLQLVAGVVRKMREEAGVGATIILHTATAFVDVPGLRMIGLKNNCMLIAIGPSELADLIKARALAEDLGAALCRARISSRYSDMLASGRIAPPRLIPAGHTPN